MAQRGIRLGVIMLCALATPAIAAGVLPLDGAYGNEPGCEFFATGRPGDDMQLVTPDTALLGKTGCDFDSAVADGDVYAVTGICSTPGEKSVKGEILKLRWVDGKVTIIDGLEAIGPLLPCTTVVDPGVDA